ncbi:unnamed protein product [Urochloa humidicola]
MTMAGCSSTARVVVHSFDQRLLLFYWHGTSPITSVLVDNYLHSEGQAALIFVRFYQCGISPLSLKSIKDAGYERMTEVQEATLPIILEGQ